MPTSNRLEVGVNALASAIRLSVDTPDSIKEVRDWVVCPGNALVNCKAGDFRWSIRKE